jgi:hypothetical protein
VNSYQDFVVLGNRLFDVLDLENVRRCISATDSGFHARMDHFGRASLLLLLRNLHPHASARTHIRGQEPQPISLSLSVFTPG